MTRRRLRAEISRYGDLDLGRVFPITNSERTAAWCAKRHWFRYSEGLRRIEDGVSAANLGTAFHDVMEFFFGQVKESGKIPNLEDLISVCYRLEAQWEKEGRSETEEAAKRLRNMVESWYRTSPFVLGSLLNDYEVEDVERSYAAPIVAPGTGRVLRPSIRVCEDSDESGSFTRLARPGEDYKRVQWAWNFVGRVDLVLRNRRTGDLVLVDHKTTGRTTGLLSTLLSDTQAPSYAWMIEAATGDRVSGFMWNVVDSRGISDPVVLKSGKISTRAKQRVPTWRLDSFLRDRELDPEAYATFRESTCVPFDRTLSFVEMMYFDRSDIERISREIFADATRIAGLYRAGCVNSSDADLDLSHPRSPVCRLPGSFCSYRGPCVSRSETGSEFTRIATVKWRHPTPTESVSDSITDRDFQW